MIIYWYVQGNVAKRELFYFCRVPVRYSSAGMGVLHSRHNFFAVAVDISIRRGDEREDVSALNQNRKS